MLPLHQQPIFLKWSGWRIPRSQSYAPKAYALPLGHTPINIFKMVTINAAKNFNIDSKVGSITKGKSADLVLIDLNNPNFYFKSLDEISFFSLLLHRTNVRDVKRVYIGGKLIYESK